MDLKTILQKSSDLLEKCATLGLENNIMDIDEFLKLCKKTGESFMDSKEYGAVIQCEHQLKYWHYMKSLVTGENDYQISGYLFA